MVSTTALEVFKYQSSQRTKKPLLVDGLWFVQVHNGQQAGVQAACSERFKSWRRPLKSCTLDQAFNFFKRADLDTDARRE